MKKLLGCKCSSKWESAGLLILRLAVGIIFLVHGYQKLQSMEQFGGFLASLGVPVASFIAVVVTLVEFLGGIALILGVFTHWSGKLLAINMFFASILVHAKNGFLVSDGGVEFTMVLFAATFALMVMGAGKWSLDAKFFKR